MKRPLLSCAIIFGAFLLVGIDQGFADTIFRVDSMGKEAMVADGVIVWDVYRFRNDPPSRVHYYYWDARACYLADMWEDFDTEKNERCRVVYSEKEQRAEIVNSIRAKGLHAKITDQVNVSADCHLFRLEYGPPTGYYYILGGAPAGEDRLPFKAKDKPQIERIPFSILKTIEFGAKDDIRILFRDGKRMLGEWKVPEEKGKRLTVKLLCIDKEGKLMHTELDTLLRIEFLYDPPAN